MDDAPHPIDPPLDAPDEELLPADFKHLHYEGDKSSDSDVDDVEEESVAPGPLIDATMLSALLEQALHDMTGRIANLATQPLYKDVSTKTNVSKFFSLRYTCMCV
jgi:hypothetical protein